MTDTPAGWVTSGDEDPRREDGMLAGRTITGATDGLHGDDMVELSSVDLTYGRVAALLDVIRTAALVTIAVALVVIA